MICKYGMFLGLILLKAQSSLKYTQQQGLI